MFADRRAPVTGEPTERANRADRSDTGITRPAHGLGWARWKPARGVREVAQRAVLGPVLHSLVTVETRGAELTEIDQPMIIVANHASHLDTPVLLSALPPEVRSRTVVGALGGALFESGWRRLGSALVFNAALLDAGAEAGRGRAPRTGRVPADALLEQGWNLLIYPEGTRSADGFLGRFADLAAELAVRHRVPLVPAGVRGTYAVMPRGRSWPGRLGPGRARPRVSVGFGSPFDPATYGDAAIPAGQPDGTPAGDSDSIAARLASAVKQLIDEDATTWWQTLRHPRTDADPADPPAGSWRRIWQETQPPGKGGQAAKSKIWPS